MRDSIKSEHDIKDPIRDIGSGQGAPRVNTPQQHQTNNAPPPQGGLTYDRDAPVTREVWQSQLAFERTQGAEREIKARDSKDWEHWYNNYVQTWNNADAATRYAIDQQHGFFGGKLIDNTPPPATHGGGGGGGGGGTKRPPKPRERPRPTPDDISPDPQDESTNDGSDMTPEDNESTIDSELVDEQNPETERSQDEDTNVEDDSLLTNRDVTPQDEVVDPVTGRRYASPAEARKAGITNWVWAYEYKGS